MTGRSLWLAVVLVAWLSRAGFAADPPSPQVPATVEVQAVAVAVQEREGVQAVVVRQAGIQQNLDRPQVSPQDNVERFVLFTQGGPIVVQVTLSLDGQPFRVPREKMVDEALALADADQDGRATWDEALLNPRFAFGRLAFQGQQNEEQRKRLAQYYDRDQDGLVTRGEVRMALAQLFGGPTFSVSDGGYRYPQATDTRTLLDTNEDQALSPDELAAAPERLKSRDADDNDVVALAELGGQDYSGFQRGAVRLQAAAQTAMLLGPTSDPAALFQTLVARYQGADNMLAEGDFPLLPGLAAALDADKNGQLDQAEVAGLNGIEPHLQLEGAFGETGASAAGLRVTSVTEALGRAEQVVTQTEGTIALILAGVVIDFSVGPEYPTYDMKAQAQAILNQFDTDKNSYLEKPEVEKVNAGFAQQFASWDENADGKVYQDEMQAFYDRQLAPMRTQLSASASEEPDPLFTVLDSSGDGRLSLREMRGAAERLKQLDADGDGQIRSLDIPHRLTVSIGRGPAQYRATSAGRLVVVGGGGAAVRAQGGQPPAGPEWFARMDRNGDGDVTPREFLGTADQFSLLDTNQDGFIERAEAEAAGQ